MVMQQLRRNLITDIFELCCGTQEILSCTVSMHGDAVFGSAC